MRYDITNIAIEDYLSSLMPARSEVLTQLEARALNQGLSLVGPVQGQFLYLMALAIGARKALEVGMTTGYAASFLVSALQQNDGHLTTIERNVERTTLAREVLSARGQSDRVTIMEGDWVALLPTLPAASFDLIFLDILRNVSNVDQATQSLDLCIPLLRPGGMLIADNVLCSALVLEPEEDASATVRGIQRFNQAVMSHAELEAVIIPLRDGVALARKKG